MAIYRVEFRHNGVIKFTVPVENDDAEGAISYAQRGLEITATLVHGKTEAIRPSNPALRVGGRGPMSPHRRLFPQRG